MASGACLSVTKHSVICTANVTAVDATSIERWFEEVDHRRQSLWKKPAAVVTGIKYLVA